MQHESVASIPHTIRYLSELLPPAAVLLGAVADNRQDLVWLGDDGHRLLSAEITPGASTIRGMQLPASADLSALALADSLQPGDSRVRLGHLFVAGRALVDGEMRPVCFPLLSRRIDLRFVNAKSDELVATPAGELEVTDLVSRPGERHALLSDAPVVVPSIYLDSTTPLFRSVDAWLTRCLTMLGLSHGGIVDVAQHPIDLMDHDTVSVVPGYGVYLDDDTGLATTAASVHDWADKAAITNTALASLIRPDLTPSLTADGDDGPLPMTVLALDSEQERIVRDARRGRILTVTGAPGTGKSRTVAALALDQVRIDRTVLLATKTRAALEVLQDFFESMPRARTGAVR